MSNPFAPPQDNSPHAITIRFCEAIFHACPWIAPASFKEAETKRKESAEQFYKTVFGGEQP